MVQQKSKARAVNVIPEMVKKFIQSFHNKAKKVKRNIYGDLKLTIVSFSADGVCKLEFNQPTFVPKFEMKDLSKKARKLEENNFIDLDQLEVNDIFETKMVTNNDNDGDLKKLVYTT